MDRKGGPGRPAKPMILKPKRRFPEMELLPRRRITNPGWRTETVLIERGLQVMNVEVVGDAYAIASNYLRKAGAMSTTIVTDDRLLEIIVGLFQRGEFNPIRLANKAIAKFESDRSKINIPITSISA